MWRLPERAAAIQAFAPAAAALAFVVLAAAAILTLPGLVARPPESFHPSPTQAFLFTPVEAERLHTSTFLKDGLIAEHVEPWREMPDHGVGSAGAAKGDLFAAALDTLRRAAHALEPEKLTKVLNGLGGGNQAAVLYHGALALYRGGELAQAEDRAEKTLDKIKASRPGKDDAASLRLDGEEASAAYLLGETRLKRGNYDGAAKAFDQALAAARSARGYPAYRTVADPFFALDPRYSLTDLSVADIWTDKLAALERLDPEKARKAAAELFENPAAVAAHPMLAASLQLIAAAAGDPVRVAAMEPNWSGVQPGDERLDRARRASAAAMLVAGDPRFMSELEGSPERDLFAPWVRLARERQLVKAEVLRAEPPPPQADGSAGDAAFLKRWRTEYVGLLGRDLLHRAQAERQHGYYDLIVRAHLFPAPIAISAALHWWGLTPTVAIVLFLCSLLLPLAFGVGGWVYFETFSPLHYANRQRKLRKAAADPLAPVREARG